MKAEEAGLEPEKQLPDCQGPHLGNEHLSWIFSPGAFPPRSQSDVAERHTSSMVMRVVRGLGKRHLQANDKVGNLGLDQIPPCWSLAGPSFLQAVPSTRGQSSPHALTGL